MELRKTDIVCQIEPVEIALRSLKGLRQAQSDTSMNGFA